MSNSYVPEIRSLKQFLSVYDLGSISRSAERCNLTQQAISRTISKLEEALGVTLFERSTHGVVPTVFADALAKRAQLILAESAQINTDLDAINRVDRGELKVGLGYAVYSKFGLDAVRRVLARTPNLSIRADVGPTAELHRKLLSGDLDVVVGASNKRAELDSALTYLALQDVFDAVVMRQEHPLAAKGKATLSELSKESWILTNPAEGRQESIAKAFIDRRIKPPARMLTINSMMLGLEWLETMDLVTLLPYEAVAQRIESGRLILYDVPELAFRFSTFIATRKNAEHAPATRAFLDIATEASHQLLPLR